MHFAVSELHLALSKNKNGEGGAKYFSGVLSALAKYQNDIISKFFHTVDAGTKRKLFDSLRGMNKRPQTFLSYAYDDKGLSLALFLYFLKQDGFLYVDWMWHDSIEDGSEIKRMIEEELENSTQFLFLRTANSELHLRGGSSIRQWCSWEIGNFYTKKKGNKYYTSFYDSKRSTNKLLDSFHPLVDIKCGCME